ncbi:MAG: 50S ribosome-binding GTPase [Candidatus Aenigmarchaeota archaeon]|nr:50S ribosome-binding GTPase [Candidatus Aenigmarchaeota archaeon]
MPTNQGPEYFAAERKYLQSRTKLEKMTWLEEMIRTSVKHKGTEKLLADLRKRLAKLKKEAYIQRKKSGKPKVSIRKEGAAQICIIGFTNSGKSTLLNSLTNAKADIASYPYTTKKPVVGMMDYEDLRFQLIEIPATFESESMSLLHTCDLIIAVLDSTQNVQEQREELVRILKENRLENKKIIFAKNKSTVCGLDRETICMDTKSGIGLEEIKERTWKALDKIRIYTKSPKKPKSIPALALKKDATVADLAKEIHKDFMKIFKYARIFNSSKFSGKKVGLDYKLHDNDVVEIHSR